MKCKAVMKTIKTILFLFLFVSINLVEAYGQRSVKGRIIDENFDEFIGARLYDRDYNLLLEADLKGFFEVNISNETNKLVFGFIGYEHANIELSDSCNYVEIILLPDAHYDFMSSRKIDRLRKKEFDKLPQLHLTAIEKGLFTNEIICYSREFEPIKPMLDEISKQMKIVKNQIKKDYKNLSVGDTIQIPFSERYTYSSLTDIEDFDCIIEGVVTKKYRKRYRSPKLSWIGLAKFWWISLERGYNFTYKVTNFENCKSNSMVHNCKEMVIGQKFEHDMKILKTIIK